MVPKATEDEIYGRNDEGPRKDRGRNRSLVGALRAIGLAVVGFVGLELLEVLPGVDVPDKAKPWVAFGLLLLRSGEGTLDAWKKGREPGRNAAGF